MTIAPNLLHLEHFHARSAVYNGNTREENRQNYLFTIRYWPLTTSEENGRVSPHSARKAISLGDFSVLRNYRQKASFDWHRREIFVSGDRERGRRKMTGGRGEEKDSGVQENRGGRERKVERTEGGGRKRERG